MSAQPVCLHPDERLDIARALMVSCGIRHLPVVENARLVGLVSAHDLMAVDLLRETTARAVMSHPVVTASPDAPTQGALDTLSHEQVSCLVIVEAERVVGIVTLSDFVECAVGILAASGDPGVASIMSHRPITTVQPTDTLDVAMILQNTQRVRHLPVLEGERLVGILSDHDLLRAIGEPVGESRLDRLRRARMQRVAEVMNRRVVTVDVTERAADAGDLLRRRRIGALPVVSRRRLVGILTVCDYFHYLQSLTPPTLEAGS